MGIFKRHRHHKAGLLSREPDQQFRRESERGNEQYEREHELTTESYRFNDEPDASEKERGFPKEGDWEPLK